MKAYRLWRPALQGEPGLLGPMGVGAPPWEPGRNEATCMIYPINGPHTPVDSDCMCGFYGFSDLSRLRVHGREELSPRGNVIAGVFEGEGRAQHHALGSRFQYATITKLYAPVERDGYDRGLLLERIYESSEFYGVPIESIANLYGRGPTFKDCYIDNIKGAKIVNTQKFKWPYVTGAAFKAYTAQDAALARKQLAAGYITKAEAKEVFLKDVHHPF